MELISRFFALVLIILLGPSFLFFSITSLAFQGFPIFFRQNRIGRDFKEFKIIKFRTMKIGSGKLVTINDDERITNYGKVLRRFKIDEIPQLVNILKGDMRFIGPRPEVKEYVDYDNFSFLKKIKPGLSDFSSIIFRNEEIILQNIGGDNPYEKLLPIKIKLATYYSRKKAFS